MNVRARILAVILTTAVVPAASADGNFYVGGSWGETNFNHDLGDFDDGSLTAGRVDDTDSGWKLFAGYRFTRNLAVEAGYALLNSDFDSETTFFDGVSNGTGPDFAAGGVSVDIHRPQGVFATAVGILPIGKSLTLRGKAGLQAWTAEVTTFDSNGVREGDETGTDPIVGLGAEYRASKRLAVRAEWERFMNIAEDDIDLLSVGVSFTLGSR